MFAVNQWEILMQDYGVERMNACPNVNMPKILTNVFPMSCAHAMVFITSFFVKCGKTFSFYSSNVTAGQKSNIFLWLKYLKMLFKNSIFSDETILYEQHVQDQLWDIENLDRYLAFKTKNFNFKQNSNLPFLSRLIAQFGVEFHSQQSTIYLDRGS